MHAKAVVRTHGRCQARGERRVGRPAGVTLRALLRRGRPARPSSMSRSSAWVPKTYTAPGTARSKAGTRPAPPSSRRAESSRPRPAHLPQRADHARRACEHGDAFHEECVPNLRPLRHANHLGSPVPEWQTASRSAVIACPGGRSCPRVRAWPLQRTAWPLFNVPPPCGTCRDEHTGSIPRCRGG